MLIMILGTRGEIKMSRPRHKRHSGVLIDNRIMLDLGERRYLKLAPEIILITHLHPDHAFFMKSGERLPDRVPVYAPENPGVEALQVIEGILVFSGYIITPVPIVHSVKVKSVGYLIEKGNKRIFYTGDIAWIEKRHLLKLKGVDAVITEGSFLRKGGLIRKNARGEAFGHNGVPELIEMFRTVTNHIILMHFGSWFMKDVSSASRKIKSFRREGLQVDIAADGEEYIV